MSVQYIRYTAVDRRGLGRVGSWHTADPAELAEHLYRKGYRSASITNFEGHEVGGVRRQIDNPRRRTWWAETSS